ncbi:MAG TPA: hypothetical protein VGK93_07810 [Candidatus Eisenbacteria bacterium]|jgi:hypothetical protein
MKLRAFILCFLLGSAIAVEAWAAAPLEPAAEMSRLALEGDGVAAPAPSTLAWLGEGSAAGEAFAAPRWAGPRWDALRYRPRRARYGVERYGPRPEGFSQIHLGFLDPDGRPSRGLILGFRGGLAVDPHIQIGGNLDWRHTSDRQTEVISEGTGPGGEPIVVRRDLSRSSSELFPVLGFLQVSAGSGLPVIPYFGLAGGYEILFLSAKDFQTGETFEGTFGGFGWQMWGGAALPLSGRARLNAEVFVNDAELSRDVDDPITGQGFRETIDMDGTGMRFGLAWGF